MVMGSCSRAGSGSSTESGPGSKLSPGGGSDADPDLRARMEQRRKRRMESNRESARRSRKRKQCYLDQLNAEVTNMEQVKHKIVAMLNFTTSNYLAIESENSVMRTQIDELSRRLSALREILHFFRDTAAFTSSVPVAGEGATAAPAFDAAVAAASVQKIQAVGAPPRCF